MELEDENIQEFDGGTLQLSPEEAKTPLDKTTQLKNDQSWWNNSVIKPIIGPRYVSEGAKNRNEPMKEVNRNALKPAAVSLVTGCANDFFTFRKGIVESAVKECIQDFAEETDGVLVAAFLLTEISLWDRDRERLLLLTDKSIFVIKYDFIALKKLEARKIPLENVDVITVGDLMYPSGSIIPHLNGIFDGVSNAVQACMFDKDKERLTNLFQPRNRNMHGVRISCTSTKPLNFLSKWNPLCDEIPFNTFTAHPLYFHKECTDDSQRKMYSVEDLVVVLSEVLRSHDMNSQESHVVIEYKDIILNNYVSIGSLIHNRNALGFFKVRGKFSF